MADKLAATFHPAEAPTELPTLDALDDMLTDAAGLLDAVAQHLFTMRHVGLLTGLDAASTQDQVQLAWATTKTTQVLFRDLMALRVPEA